MRLCVVMGLSNDKISNSSKLKGFEDKLMLIQTITSTFDRVEKITGKV